MIPDAALAVVRAPGRPRGAPLWLAVVRREPPHEWAIPGGEVEPGETPAAAVVRELAEETGACAAREALRPVWLGRSPTDGRRVRVYAVGAWAAPRGLAGEGGAPLAWIEPRVLRDQAVLFRPFLDAMLRQVAP